MNTKLVMTLSTIVLGMFGVTLTFAPDLILDNLSIEVSRPTLLLAQIIGGLYLGFSMLNWMTKESLIGGIYNRPIAVANFTHFLVAGLAIIKALIAQPELPVLLWVTGIVYTILGLLYTVILFSHPVKS